MKSFDRGQLVLDQNVLLRAIFLIEDGSVRVERRDREQTVPLAILQAGEFFGEMSYVDGAPTSARVIADEPTRLRVIDEATVDSLIRKDPSFAGRLYRSIAAILAERLRLTSMRLERLRRMTRRELRWRALAALRTKAQGTVARLRPPRWRRADLGRALAAQALNEELRSALQSGRWPAAHCCSDPNCAR